MNVAAVLAGQAAQAGEENKRRIAAGLAPVPLIATGLTQDADAQATQAAQETTQK